MQKAIFCIMGPTASGKTVLACELVRHFPFEIVSIDSAMIYREMNIGTAKPDQETLLSAPHHLIDIVNPPDSYSAARCCSDVLVCCDSIIKQGKIPLLVGGTMMYFRALQQGLSILPEADESTRLHLFQLAQEHGWGYLHQKLAHVDPSTAARIHPHDTQRIQRALEVFQLTGKPLSVLLNGTANSPDRHFVNLIITPNDRAWLHERIALRFQSMLIEGLLDEVEQVIQKWALTDDCPAMRCVGYRQAHDYLQGAYDYNTLMDKGIAATRQLAKRQLTWLRHWPNGYHFIAENPTNLKEMMELIQQMLDNPRKSN
ncbi:MAG: tRNA (adenosine(37)-N6)-dimethylallyltransferase MiaA [Legionellaceae bacterium]|nr:tRNA (adenosine(37)-N6)-dimethylallyltransferase MiaA [Legionellaceae bacterium]